VHTSENLAQEENLMTKSVTVRAKASALFLSTFLVLTTFAWIDESVTASKPTAVNSSRVDEAQPVSKAVRY